MAVNQKQTCDLYVTCIDKIGPLLKIWGQTDRQTSIYIETVLMELLKVFEQQNFVIPVSSLHHGLICCAKYKDGIYYRAQIINLTTQTPGTVEVRFIDYGNTELIRLENIRLFNEQTLRLSSIKPQASDYILAGVMHTNNDWDVNSLASVHEDIGYTEQKIVFIHTTPNYKLIKVLYQQIDLANYLICKGLCTSVPIQTQEIYLQSTIPQQQIAQIPIMTKQMPVFNFPPPMAVQPPSMLTYKPATLPLNSEHLVYVSYVEDGPHLFSVQLQSMEENLHKLMNDINELKQLPLSEPPVPGHPCMARCIEDKSVCRAVVLNLVDDKCKTYYVDFGNTDVLPFNDIFQIPPSFIVPKVMSMRFTLAGLKNINVTNEMKCSFKTFVTNKLLRLKVVKEGASSLMQYCELYDANSDVNIIEMLLNAPSEFKTLQLNKGAKHNVNVSFIEGCKKFFVQLKECTESLNSLMVALQATSDESVGLDVSDLKPGIACVAYYSGDSQWYRANILSLEDNRILVKYVDYGNEDQVPINMLKKINKRIVDILPAQAIECCLYGYQNMKFDSAIENIFESLTLECEFTMKVISKQSNGVVLVDLFDMSGNNVAALLIEKLAAQKSQISLPSQQIANKIINDNQTNYNQISFETKDKSPKSDKSFGNKRTERQQSWRSDNSDEKKNWRNSEEKKNWRDTEEKKNWRDTEEKSWRNPTSPSEEKPAKYQNMKKSDNENRKVSHKKRREKWNDHGAGGDSWNNKKREDGPRTRGENWDDKKSFKTDLRQKLDAKRQNNREDKPFQKKEWNDERKPQFKSRENKYGRLNSQEWDENASNASHSSHGSKRGKSFSPKKDYSSPKREIPKNLEPLADFTEPFKINAVEIGSNDTVAISWFYNPENFFCQVLSQESNFKNMMTEIQTAYSNNKRPVSGPIAVGSSVIAEFSEDNILYRAIILENKGSKYKVQYVDFGNMSLVDSNKIYQVESRFMELPVQCVRCGISNIKSTSEVWPINEEVDKIFNKASFVCVFENILEDKYEVQLWDGDVCIKNQLIECGLGKDAGMFQMDGEPVDVNMAFGQNIRVTISYVYSLDRFCVQMNKLKVTQIEEALNTYVQNSAALQLMSKETILPDTNCLVNFEEKWYRVLIMDQSDPEAITVLCPDTGKHFEVTAKNLYILPAELCIYWYQAFECTLNNLINDSCRLISDEKFKSDYEGKELIMYVNYIENNKCFVTLYDLTGQKLELFTPDEEAYPTVDVICPLPVLTSSLTVFITHINNANSIYIQQTSDSELIAELLEKMYEYYESNGEQAQLTVQGLCCAKSNDGNWYRGKIEEVKDDSVKVLYVDYGNSEEVTNENVKGLVEQFYEPNELALHVSLNLEGISEDFNDKLTELTSEKDLKCIIYFDNAWIVELFLGGESINKILVDSQLAKYPDTVQVLENAIPESSEIQELNTVPESSEIQELNAVPESSQVQELEDHKITPHLCICPAKPTEKTDMKRCGIFITHVDTPSEFYAQLKANENDITTLQDELQSKIDSLQNMEGAEIGSLCAAKYSVDELWYRAEVLDADQDITTVRFVDFGNTDVIDNTANHLKTLSSELLAIDKYAKKCSLNISSTNKTKTEEWSQEACDIFNTEIEKRDFILFADIIYQDEKNKHYVDLYDEEGNNIAQPLLDRGFADHITRDVEDNIANNTGFVSHLNSISEFWIQLESSIPDLEMIVERMTEVESFPDLEDLSPGMLCAANFPEDESWYRARILSNTVAGIEVIFIDYGNSSNALKIKELPEDLVHMPALAQKCSLNKPQSVVQWTDQATEKFREIAEDGATVFNIKKLAAGETAVVELFINGSNIVDQLVSLCDDETRPVPIGDTEFVKCYINHIESVDKFWVSTHTDQETLDDVMNQLTEAETFEPLTDMTVGKLCAAFDESTSIWYRAMVVCPEQVQLYDYGNIIPANNLRILPAEIEKIPQISFLCTLDLPNDLNCKEVLEKFLEINAQINNEYEIKFLNNETPRLVRVYIDGIDICEKLIKGENILNYEPDEIEKNQVNEDVKKNVLNEVEPDVENLIENDEVAEKYENKETEKSDDKETEKSEIKENEKSEVKEPEVEEDETNEVISKIEDIKLASKDTLVNGVETEMELKENMVTEILRSSDEVLTDNLYCFKQELDHGVDGKQCYNGRPTAIVNDFYKYRDDDFVKENSSQTDISEIEVVEIVEPTNLEITQDSNESELCESFNNLSLKDNVSYKYFQTKLINENNIFDCIYEKYPSSSDLKNKFIFSLNENMSNITNFDNKIVPGSISRGDISMQIPRSDLAELKVYFDLSAKCYDDKIVPGSISRGDLTKPVFDTRPISYDEKIVPGSISRGDLTQPEYYFDFKSKNKIVSNTQTDLFFNMSSNNIVSGLITQNDTSDFCFQFNPKTNENKIVPGSISRGDLSSNLFFDFTATTDTSKSNVLFDSFIPQLDKSFSFDSNVTYLSLCHDDKIVPGSISRGYLEKPVYTVTLPENKIVPGSISRGILHFNIEPVVLNFDDSSDEIEVHTLDTIPANSESENIVYNTLENKLTDENESVDKEMMSVMTAIENINSYILNLSKDSYLINSLQQLQKDYEHLSGNNSVDSPMKIVKHSTPSVESEKEFSLDSDFEISVGVQEPETETLAEISNISTESSSDEEPEIGSSNFDC